MSRPSKGRGDNDQAFIPRHVAASQISAATRIATNSTTTMTAAGIVRSLRSCWCTSVLLAVDGAEHSAADEPGAARSARRRRPAAPVSAQPLPALLAHLAPLLNHYGYLAVGGFIGLEDFGVPVPGETILIAAAVYSGAGRLSIVGVGLVAMLAAVAGDNIGYAVGYFDGRALVLRFGKYVGLTSERLARGRGFLRPVRRRRRDGRPVHRRAAPGERIIAGTIRRRWPRFLAFNAPGAALWVGVWASVGYLAGGHITAIYNTVSRYWLYLLIALAVTLTALIIRAVVRRHCTTGTGAAARGPTMAAGPGGSARGRRAAWSWAAVRRTGAEPQTAGVGTTTPRQQDGQDQ